jgi:hypothetical protein
MGVMSTIHFDLTERIVEEVNKGFDTRDEMREVFIEIAQDLNVPTSWVWEVFLQGRWRY